MNRSLAIPLGVAAISTAAIWFFQPFGDQAGTADTRIDRTLVDRYCADCHNSGERAGGLSLVEVDPRRAHENAEIWEAVIKKVSAGMMPPPGELRPTMASLENFAASLADTIDDQAAANPNPGAPVLHRLNRTEYGNAIRDLFALPIDVTTLLPADDSSEGFDNIANALSISPAHMQAYVSAAARISRLAVGDITASPMNVTYNANGGLDHTYHQDGLILGTRGGFRATHVFPLDAEYEFSVRRFGGGIFVDSVGGDETLVVTLDGARIFSAPPGVPSTFRIEVTAGPHEIAATLIEHARPYGVDDMYSTLARTNGVSGVSILGPFNAVGPGDTPSRELIFNCRPNDSAQEIPCARQILSHLASRAWRRPVAPNDTAMDALMDQYATGSSLRGFETGIQYGIARILVDPEFIFRFETEPADVGPGSIYAISDLELASRLAFFLWSSVPDDTLRELAVAGDLSKPDVLEAQVQRMLADEKSASLVTSFAAQWLMLRQLDSVNPADPAFDANLRYSMRRETELLFESIVREDYSIVDLLDADYTFVDERLARHYGLSDIRGSQFRRVQLTDPARFGLLGHASVLTVTSAPNRTSPVIRGAWILEHILGTPAPLPPPGVETSLEAEVSAESLPVSLRARLEAHREDPSCAACHAIIDPLGFALENFDEIGRWREFDGREAVNASGVLWDGTSLEGPASLRAALLARRTAFARVAVEKLLTYALGRAVEYYDMPAVREIAAGAAEQEYRFSSLVLGIVDSVPFRMKRVESLNSAEIAAIVSEE